MWPLNNEKKQQLDKKRKKNAKLCNTFFFSKFFFSKDIKAIN